jgi:hypothetical protein
MAKRQSAEALPRVGRPEVPHTPVLRLARCLSPLQGSDMISPLYPKTCPAINLQKAPGSGFLAGPPLAGVMRQRAGSSGRMS